MNPRLKRFLNNLVDYLLLVFTFSVCYIATLFILSVWAIWMNGWALPLLTAETGHWGTWVFLGWSTLGATISAIPLLIFIWIYIRKGALRTAAQEHSLKKDHN